MVLFELSTSDHRQLYDRVWFYTTGWAGSSSVSSSTHKEKSSGNQTESVHSDIWSVLTFASISHRELAVM